MPHVRRSVVWRRRRVPMLALAVASTAAPAGYAKSFQIQTSNDAATWTTIYSMTTGTGGTQTLTVAGNGRYVRMYGTARATACGYPLCTTNAALNRPVSASSTENAGSPATAAVDGNTGFHDLLTVSLGGAGTIGERGELPVSPRRHT
jgi:hypothetical protein